MTQGYVVPVGLQQAELSLNHGEKALRLLYFLNGLCGGGSSG